MRLEDKQSPPTGGDELTVPVPLYGDIPEGQIFVTNGLGASPTGGATAYKPVAPIPEFSTIAIPVAGILGLALYFNRRRFRNN